MSIPFSRAAIAVLLMWAGLSMPVYGQPAPPPEHGQLPKNELVPPGAAIGETPGGMMPGADPFMLLENSRQVQADLDLSEDQIRRLGHSGQLFRNQLQELAHATDAAAKSEMQRQIWTSRGAIAKILDRQQLQRLQQIMLQIEGPCLAVNDPRFSQELDLSETQVTSMATTCRQVAMEMRAAFRPPTVGEEPCTALYANRDRLEGLRAQGRSRVVALLSTSQQRRLQDMQGHELTLEPLVPPQCTGRKMAPHDN